MKKEIWIVVMLAVIIVILAGILFLTPSKPWENPPAGTEGLLINSPKANDAVSSPLKITGVVSGSGWTGFEGQVGTVRLLDGTGKELVLGILTATTEWTTLPTNFETTLSFKSDVAQSGTLVFRNENPSGDPIRDKTFSLPVKISAGSVEAITLKTYFNNSNLDPEFSCNKVFPVNRVIASTSAVARAALEELFLGPTDFEKSAGFFTSINGGVKIQSLTIENGTAKVDFDEQLEFQVGGSCRVSAIRAQITETLKQFSTIKNVIISINGRTEDILQP